MTKCKDCGHDLRLHITGCRDCVTCLRRARGAVCTHSDSERGPKFQTECVKCDEEDAGIASERKQPCDHVCSGNCRREGCNCLCGEWHEVEPVDGMLLAKDEKYA